MWNGNCGNYTGYLELVKAVSCLHCFCSRSSVTLFSHVTMIQLLSLLGKTRKWDSWEQLKIKLTYISLRFLVTITIKKMVCFTFLLKRFPRQSQKGVKDKGEKESRLNVWHWQARKWLRRREKKKKWQWSCSNNFNSNEL